VSEAISRQSVKDMVGRSNGKEGVPVVCAEDQHRLLYNIQKHSQTDTIIIPLPRVSCPSGGVGGIHNS
jgi:hypothetical protein